MKNYTVRLAEPRDSEAFAEWTASNPRITPSDIDDVAKTTPITIVIEADGQAEAFAPLIPALTVGFIGLRPGQDAKTLSACLHKIIEGIQSVQNTFQINDAYVHTTAEMPIARWALKHGFEEKEQDTYVLRRR